jgi:hypothetical protein
VRAYTNKKGEISYELPNKALIQAAFSNPYLVELVARSASEAEIRGQVRLTGWEWPDAFFKQPIGAIDM